MGRKAAPKAGAITAVLGIHDLERPPKVDLDTGPAAGTDTLALVDQE